MATVYTRFLITQYLSSLDNDESSYSSSDPIFTRFKAIGDKLKDNSLALTNPESTISWLSDLNDTFTRWRSLKKQKKSKGKISSAVNPKLSHLEKLVSPAEASLAKPSQQDLLPSVQSEPDLLTSVRREPDLLPSVRSEPDLLPSVRKEPDLLPLSEPDLLPLVRYTSYELHPTTSTGDKVYDEQKKVVDWVNDFKAVGIYGTGGSGKTEFVKNIVKHMTVGDKFKCVIWVCLSQLNSVEEIDEWIIKYLLHRLGLDTDSLVGNLEEDRDWLMGELGRRLLNSGSYILVLDDMWHCSDWFSGEFLGKLRENGGGAVIVTSRKKTVAEKIGEKKRMIHLNCYERALVKDEDKV